MNTIVKFLIGAAFVSAMASCENADMNTVIHEDGSCSREISVRAGDCPERFDDDGWEVSKIGGDSVLAHRVQNYSSVQEMCADWSTHENGYATLQSKGSFASKFKLFYTYYYYTETFSFPDTLISVPANKFLTADQASYWATGKPNLVEGLSGAYAADKLNDLSTKVDKWEAANLANMVFDLMEAHYSEFKDAPLDLDAFHASREEMLLLISNKAVLDDDALCQFFNHYFEDNAYSRFLRDTTTDFYKAREDLSARLGLLGQRSYNYCLQMPGKIVDSNVGFCDGSVMRCEVNYHLMADKYNIQVISRKANVWVFALAVIILIAAVASYFIKVRK